MTVDDSQVSAVVSGCQFRCFRSKCQTLVVQLLHSNIILTKMTQDLKKRKDVKKEKKDHKEEKSEDTQEGSPSGDVKPKFGPHISFPYQRVWSRCALILGVLFIVWYNSKQGKEISLARQKEILLSRSQNIECSENYKAKISKHPECVPEKCGRVVTDKLVSATDADVLLKLAIRGLNLGDSNGGSSMLDLHSGTFSDRKGVADIYNLPEAKKIFNNADLAIYRVVKTKLQHAIAHNFGVSADKIYLTKPTFFSRLTNIPGESIYDEYWHPHMDKEIYESIHYTSLVYLSDYGRDFEGGRFIFTDKNNVNTTVEPRKGRELINAFIMLLLKDMDKVSNQNDIFSGRVTMFTSGSENLHAVEKMKSGTQYALHVFFTCNQNAAIPDPNFGSRVKQKK